MPQAKNRSGVDFPEKEIHNTAPLARPTEFSARRPSGPDLGQILLPVILRWWFLLVVPVICGGLGYYLVAHNTTYYQGRMLLGVGPAAKDIEMTVPEILNLRLTASYIQLVSTDRFLQLVAQQTGTKLDLDTLHQSIVASGIKDTPYFEFQIVGTNSDEVLKMLGSIRDLLINESPQFQEMRSQSQQEFLSARKQELQTLISDSNQKLTILSNNPVQDTPVVDTTGSSTSSIREELDAYNQELSEITQYSSTNVTNQLHVVDNPHLLTDKLGAQPRDGAFALAAISFALVVILVVLLEKWDPRLRDAYQIETILANSVLLSVKPRREKSPQIDLVAAELLVRVHEHAPKDSARYRLLFFIENQSVNPELNLNNLAAALVSLGINCTIRNGITGENRAFPLPDYQVQPYPTTETGLAVINYNPNDARESWELIELKWPVALPIAGNLARQADDVVVLCSLGKSYRQSLYKLRDFLTKAAEQPPGVIII